MSGKSNKPKKAAKPSNVPEEEVPLQATEDISAETPVQAKPAAKGKKQDKANDSPKKNEQKKSVPEAAAVKKGVDPIILVSAIVFFAACFVVIGATIYDVTLADHSQARAEYGNEVVVDYTGSYFNYYDRGGSVFDTTLENVTNSSDYAKSYEFKAKTTFETIKFTIGEGTYLSMFEGALVNHRPGETIRVAIPAADGYGTLTEGVDEFTVNKAGNTVSKVGGYTSDQFKKFFGFEVPKELTDKSVSEMTVKSPYGWDCKVVCGGANLYSVDFGCYAEAGQTYRMNDKVELKVTGITSSEIVFDYVIGNFDVDKDMAKIIIDGETVYAIKSTADKIVYKTTEEKVGAKLFFVIKFIEYAKSE